MRRNQMPQPWSLAGVQSEKKKKTKALSGGPYFCNFSRRPRAQKFQSYDMTDLDRPVWNRKNIPVINIIRDKQFCQFLEARFRGKAKQLRLASQGKRLRPGR